MQPGTVSIVNGKWTADVKFTKDDLTSTTMTITVNTAGNQYVYLCLVAVTEAYNNNNVPPPSTIGAEVLEGVVVSW